MYEDIKDVLRFMNKGIFKILYKLADENKDLKRRIEDIELKMEEERNRD